MSPLTGERYEMIDRMRRESKVKMGIYRQRRFSLIEAKMRCEAGREVGGLLNSPVYPDKTMRLNHCICKPVNG